MLLPVQEDRPQASRPSLCSLESCHGLEGVAHFATALYAKLALCVEHALYIELFCTLGMPYHLRLRCCLQLVDVKSLISLIRLAPSVTSVKRV